MTSFKRIHPACPALLLAALAFPSAAIAQSDDHVTLGVGAGVVPDYLGSDDYRFLPIPVIDAQFGQFFVSLRNGIGVNVIETGPLTAGASVALVGGDRRRDVPEGVRRVSTTAGGRLFANLKLDKLFFTLGATMAVAGGARGVVADASLSYAFPLSDRMTVIPTARVRELGERQAYEPLFRDRRGRNHRFGPSLLSCRKRVQGRVRPGDR